MARNWNFEAAADCWRELRAAETVSPDDWARFEEAEMFLLRSKPTTKEQAGAVIEVMMDQCGERSDGLDQLALNHIHQFVRPGVTITE